MKDIIIPDLFLEKTHVLQELISYFSNNRMGYINVPTGWGKIFLSKHFIRDYIIKKKKVLYLISRNNQLLIQTYYRDINNKTPLFPSSISLSSDFGTKDLTANEVQKKIIQNNTQIVFASLQTILSGRLELKFKSILNYHFG